IPLIPLELSEALQWLQGLDTDQRALQDLFAKLGGLPLALAQAKAYIQRTRQRDAQYNLKTYLEDLEKNPDVLWKAKGVDRHEQSLAKTWALSLSGLREENPLAEKWLNISAYLTPDGIPQSWVQSWLQTQGLDENECKMQGDTVLDTLLSYSLIR